MSAETYLRIADLHMQLAQELQRLAGVEVLTVSEYAQRFKMNAETVRRQCVEGRLNAHQTAPGGHWRIEVAS